MMGYRHKITICLVAGITVVAGALLVFKHLRHSSQQTVATHTSPSPTPEPYSRVVQPSLAGNEQISLSDQTREEAMQAWWQRRERDKTADWKVPIRFYGKVIDQDMQPVSGANVHFQWTDLSVNGTSDTDTMTDTQGFFSLTGVQGKNLVVRVTKQGYLASKRQRSSFEFADPAESTYHEANPGNPVIFYLRKVRGSAELIQRSVEILLQGDGSTASVDLRSGKLSEAGELRVQSFKPWPPRSMSPHYDWKVKFEIAGGGFVEAHEEFAFEAPEAGYSSPFDLNMSATAGDAWKVSVDKTFYFAFGNPRKYGRLKFRTSGNSRYIFIDYVINPSGSRNLEGKNDALRANRP